jgi:type IV pilus assembly protein PilB
MSDHEFEGQDVQTTAGGAGGAGAPQPPSAIHGVAINKTAELVLDLLSNTNLIAPDRLALVRGRAGPGGSFSQAIVDEGIATSEGIARLFAARHQLPLVDLSLAGVQEEASRTIPTHVLERVVAIPYASDAERLWVAVADPLDLHGLDQLRLATTLKIEVGVASRDDIAREIAKVAAAQMEGGAGRLRTADEPTQPTPGGEISESLGVTVNKTAELVADLLGSANLVSADKLALVRGRAGPGGSIAQALVDEGVASSEGIARMFAARHELPLVDLAHVGVDDRAASAISAHVLERVVAIPYALEGDTLHIAVADPSDLHGLDQLRLSTTHRVEIGVASRDEIASFLGSIVRAAETTSRRARAHIDEEAFVAEYEGAEDDTDLDLEDGVSDAPLVRLVNSVLFQAAEDGASDVHFEPQEDALVVRFRIDGVLQEVQRIPKRMMAGVTTRLKVLAKLDIAERRKPQDGRISLNAAAAGRTLDVRVATLPTVEGESLVMRLLDKSKRPPTLTELGLADQMRETMERIIRRPTGALLVTGPTGSGKSTTLFAALTEINRSEINIITVEDPVEYRVAGVNQVQINTRAGLTFATALRSILRSDPDVVMVGEIRDSETAKISIEAALTGHFVLSTLHTNDAPSALTRLNEMGVEPFLTGAAVTGVLAQRLARKLCSHCAEMYTPSHEELIAARISPDVAAATDGMAFYRKRGCPRCNQTGYKGRIGIYQLLEMNEELASLAAAKASREEIDRSALGAGMRTLWDDGMAKVAQGLTSIEELARVTV